LRTCVFPPAASFLIEFHSAPCLSYQRQMPLWRGQMEEVGDSAQIRWISGDRWCCNPCPKSRNKTRGGVTQGRNESTGIHTRGKGPPLSRCCAAPSLKAPILPTLWKNSCRQPSWGTARSHFRFSRARASSTGCEWKWAYFSHGHIDGGGGGRQQRNGEDIPRERHHSSRKNPLLIKAGSFSSNTRPGLAKTKELTRGGYETPPQR
jgi:hypothetical protein